MAEGLPTVQGRAITQPGNISNAGLADRQASDMYGRVAQAAVQIGNALKPAEIKRGQDDALRDFNEADKFARDIGADSVGQVTKRSGFMGLETAGDVAYNNMMETLYLQRTERDLEAKAKELASNPDTFGDIDAFDKGFLEWFQGYSTNIETDFADEIVFRAERVRELSRNSIAQQVQANNIAEAKATMDADLASMKESILADFDAPEHDDAAASPATLTVGDRRQEVVFIGPGLASREAQAVLRAAVDACLLNDEEWEVYRAARHDEASLARFENPLQTRMLTY